MPEVRKIPAFARLPYEIFEHIIDSVEEFPIDSWDALEFREELMTERSEMNTNLEETLGEVGPEIECTSAGSDAY